MSLLKSVVGISAGTVVVVMLAATDLQKIGLGFAASKSSHPQQAAAVIPAQPLPPKPTPIQVPSNAAYLYAQGNGHFMADLQIRGTPIRAMVDTGATVIAMSYEDAERIGRRPEPNDRTAKFNTANGTVTAHLVKLSEVRLQGITVYDVDAAIMPKGAMKGTLLGMSFMRKLSGVETRGATMVMRQ
jgi:aspartyl protease family protein